MIEIAQAEELIRKHQRTGETTRVSVFDACGLTLAEDVVATEPLPRYTNSAMDGLAVHAPVAEDLEIEIIGESSAGKPFAGTVGGQQGVRISTGAMIPAGANAVVPEEELLEREDGVFVAKSPIIGQHIRKRGEEAGQGDVLFPAGCVVTPPVMGLLLSTGKDRVRVVSPPRVSVLTTGSEVQDVEVPLAEYQIRNTNQIMLSGVLQCINIKPGRMAHVGDDFGETVAVLKQMAEESDIVITTGGVSVGLHDLVRKAARQTGFQEVFWKIRQKPGKPMFFARSDKSVLFGLPGNPVSALICALHYVWPYVHRFRGRTELDRTVEAIVERPVRNKGDRDRFVLVALERTGKGWSARQVKLQRSHMVSGPVHACGYIMLKPEQQVAGGERVPVTRFPWRCPYGDR